MTRRLTRAITVTSTLTAATALLAFGATHCGTNGNSGEADPAEARAVSEAASVHYNWLQFGGDSRHSGNNTLETTLTPQNVNGLVQLFKISLPETIEGAPVVLTHVNTSSGFHDIAYMTTRTGVLLAIDAFSGATLWSRQPTNAQITMSSPAIDPSLAYVYSTGLDGHLHKYTVGDGTETTTGGWPELFTLKPTVEKGGTAITIATTGGVPYLYMGVGGYDGDGGDYQGHVTTINLNTGAQKVFNGMCSDQTVHFSFSVDCSSAKSGIWAKAGLTFDPATSRLYAVTGNGTFNAASHLWGDSIIALNPDGSGANGNPVDSYTPTNFQALQNSDKDLGSTNMLILPNNGSKYPHLGAQSGKDQLVRLINLDNMSGQGGPGHVAGEVSSAALPTGGENQNPSSTWVNPADNSTWLFFVSPSNGINAFRLSVDGSGNPSLVAMWHLGGGGGGSAIANNVLYYATDSTLHALTPTTGAELWRGAGIGAIHWQTPTIANGVVYIGDKGRKLTAFALPGTNGGGSGGATGAGGATGSGGSGNAGTGGTGTSGATLIDCGGPAAAPYSADVGFSGGSVIHHADTIDTNGVSSAAPAAVYQYARSGNFTYTVPGFVANSSHIIRLHFAETYFTTANSRTFNVIINGTQYLTAFDIFAATGAKDKAIAKTFAVQANASGAYVIQAQSVINNSLLSGIEIQ